MKIKTNSGNIASIVNKLTAVDNTTIDTTTFENRQVEEFRFSMLSEEDQLKARRHLAPTSNNIKYQNTYTFFNFPIREDLSIIPFQRSESIITNEDLETNEQGEYIHKDLLADKIAGRLRQALANSHQVNLQTEGITNLPVSKNIKPNGEIETTKMTLEWFKNNFNNLDTQRQKLVISAIYENSFHEVSTVSAILKGSYSGQIRRMAIENFNSRLDDLHNLVDMWKISKADEVNPDTCHSELVLNINFINSTRSSLEFKEGVEEFCNKTIIGAAEMKNCSRKIFNEQKSVVEDLDWINNANKNLGNDIGKREDVIFERNSKLESIKDLCKLTPGEFNELNFTTLPDGIQNKFEESNSIWAKENFFKGKNWLGVKNKEFGINLNTGKIINKQKIISKDENPQLYRTHKYYKLYKNVKKETLNEEKEFNKTLVSSYSKNPFTRLFFGFKGAFLNNKEKIEENKTEMINNIAGLRREGTFLFNEIHGISNTLETLPSSKMHESKKTGDVEPLTLIDYDKLIKAPKKISDKREEASSGAFEERGPRTRSLN